MKFKGKTEPSGMAFHAEHVLSTNGKVIAVIHNHVFETEDQEIIHEMKSLGYEVIEEEKPEAPQAPAPPAVKATEKKKGKK